MKFYGYLVQRQKENNNTYRYILILDKKIYIKEKVVDRTNLIGVKLFREGAETISYIGSCEEEDLDLFRDILLEKYNLSIYIEKQGHRYFILNRGASKKGVWKENNLIVHQLKGYENLDKEVYKLRGVAPDFCENRETNGVVKFLNEWKNQLNKFNYLNDYKFIISFIMSINKFYKNKNEFENLIFYKYKFFESLNFGKKVFVENKEQFQKYVEKSILGELNCIPEDMYFYSKFPPNFLIHLYNQYINVFLDYINLED